MSDAARPLDGVLVVDLSRYLPGPLVGRILGDLGARVIKVEEPSLGDPVRLAPPLRGGQSALATLLLSGHESLALDLEKEPAKEALAELLALADVLVESFRPGRLARLGLDPVELRRRFPRLVVCSVSGWGQEGPHASRAGHDLGYQAIAGALAGAAGRPTTPAVQVADVVGGWSAAAAVLAALVRRERDGVGAWIDAALLDAAGHAAITARAAEAGGAREVGEALPLTGELPGYRVYRAADGGQVALANLEPRFWQRFCLAVGRPDLVPRGLGGKAARDEVAAIVASRPRAAWAAFFAEHDLPGEPVLSLAESAAHPQVVARELVRAGEDGLPRAGFPARFDGERPRGGERFPALGGDSERLVAEFGLAGDLTPGERRRGGIGKRRSLRRWLLGVAAGLLRR